MHKAAEPLAFAPRPSSPSEISEVSNVPSQGAAETSRWLLSEVRPFGLPLALSPAQENRLVVMFQHCDPSGSGVIRVEELQHLCRSSSFVSSFFASFVNHVQRAPDAGPSDASEVSTALALLAEADSNKDGTVTLAELRRVCIRAMSRAAAGGNAARASRGADAVSANDVALTRASEMQKIAVVRLLTPQKEEDAQEEQLDACSVVASSATADGTSEGVARCLSKDMENQAVNRAAVAGDAAKGSDGPMDALAAGHTEASRPSEVQRLATCSVIGSASSGVLEETIEGVTQVITDAVQDHGANRSSANEADGTNAARSACSLVGSEASGTLDATIEGVAKRFSKDVENHAVSRPAGAVNAAGGGGGGIARASDTVASHASDMQRLASCSLVASASSATFDEAIAGVSTFLSRTADDQPVSRPSGASDLVVRSHVSDAPPRSQMGATHASEGAGDVAGGVGSSDVAQGVARYPTRTTGDQLVSPSGAGNVLMRPYGSDAASAGEIAARDAEMQRLATCSVVASASSAAFDEAIEGVVKCLSNTIEDQPVIRHTGENEVGNGHLGSDTVRASSMTAPSAPELQRLASCSVVSASSATLDEAIEGVVKCLTTTVEDQTESHASDVGEGTTRSCGPDAAPTNESAATRVPEMQRLATCSVVGSASSAVFDEAIEGVAKCLPTTMEDPPVARPADAREAVTGRLGSDTALEIQRLASCSVLSACSATFDEAIEGVAKSLTRAVEDHPVSTHALEILSPQQEGHMQEEQKGTSSLVVSASSGALEETIEGISNFLSKAVEDHSQNATSTHSNATIAAIGGASVAEGSHEGAGARSNELEPTATEGAVVMTANVEQELMATLQRAISQGPKTVDSPWVQSSDTAAITSKEALLHATLCVEPSAEPPTEPPTRRPSFVKASEYEPSKVLVEEDPLLNDASLIDEIVRLSCAADNAKEFGQMQLKIDGINYDWLVSFVELTEAVKTEIKKAVVEATGSQVKEADVHVDLAKGSVVATIKTFEPTIGMLKSSSILTNLILTKISGILGINAVKNGDIVVRKTDSDDEIGTHHALGLLANSASVKTLASEAESTAQQVATDITVGAATAAVVGSGLTSANGAVEPRDEVHHAFGQSSSVKTLPSASEATTQNAIRADVALSLVAATAAAGAATAAPSMTAAISSTGELAVSEPTLGIGNDEANQAGPLGSAAAITDAGQQLQKLDMAPLVASSSQMTLTRITDIATTAASGHSSGYILGVSAGPALTLAPLPAPTPTQYTDADSAAEELTLHNKLWDIFQRCDLNGDGSINKRELVKVLRQDPEIASLFGLPTHIRQEDGTRTAMERWFQKIDADGDRTLSWAEFCNVFHSGPFSSTEVHGALALANVQAQASAPVRKTDPVSLSIETMLLSNLEPHPSSLAVASSAADVSLPALTDAGTAPTTTWESELALLPASRSPRKTSAKSWQPTEPESSLQHDSQDEAELSVGVLKELPVIPPPPIQAQGNRRPSRIELTPSFKRAILQDRLVAATDPPRQSKVVSTETYQDILAACGRELNPGCGPSKKIEILQADRANGFAAEERSTESTIAPIEGMASSALPTPERLCVPAVADLVKIDQERVSRVNAHARDRLAKLNKMGLVPPIAREDMEVPEGARAGPLYPNLPAKNSPPSSLTNTLEFQEFPKEQREVAFAERESGPSAAEMRSYRRVMSMKLPAPTDGDGDTDVATSPRQASKRGAKRAQTAPALAIDTVRARLSQANFAATIPATKNTGIDLLADQANSDKTADKAGDLEKAAGQANVTKPFTKLTENKVAADLDVQLDVKPERSASERAIIDAVDGDFAETRGDAGTVPPLFGAERQAAFDAIRIGDVARLADFVKEGKLHPAHVDSSLVVDAQGRTLLEYGRIVGTKSVLNLLFRLLTKQHGEVVALGEELEEKEGEEDECRLEYPTLPCAFLLGGQEYMHLPEFVKGSFRRNCHVPAGINGMSFPPDETLFNFRISPALPSGLVLDENTGALRGVPDEEAGRRMYTIRATLGNGGKDIAKLRLQPQQRELECAVDLAVEYPLDGLSYPSAELILEVGPNRLPGEDKATMANELPALDPLSAKAVSTALERPVTPTRGAMHRPAKYFSAAPSLQSGVPEAFEVWPPLPQGLTVDEHTGVIQGLPLHVTTGYVSNHTVVARNALGMTSCTVHLQADRGEWGLIWFRFVPERAKEISTAPSQADQQPLSGTLQGSEDTLLDRINCIPSRTSTEASLPEISSLPEVKGGASHLEAPKGAKPIGMLSELTSNSALHSVTPPRELPPVSPPRSARRNYRHEQPGIRAVSANSSKRSDLGLAVDWASAVRKCASLLRLFGQPVLMPPGLLGTIDAVHEGTTSGMSKRTDAPDATGSKLVVRGMGVSSLLRMLGLDSDSASSHFLLKAINISNNNPSMVGNSPQMAVLPAGLTRDGCTRMVADEPLIVLRPSTSIGYSDTFGKAALASHGGSQSARAGDKSYAGDTQSTVLSRYTQRVLGEIMYNSAKKPLTGGELPALQSARS